MFTPIGEVCMDRLLMHCDMLHTFDDEHYCRNAHSCQMFSRSASKLGPGVLFEPYNLSLIAVPVLSTHLLCVPDGPL
jgi:hypothetical protein